MGGITVDDFTSSVIYREIYGRGQQEGRDEGRQEGRDQGRRTEAAALTLRQLQKRFGSLASAQQERINALPLPALEALAEDLLDFSGPDDLATWLGQ